jgi:hypothetical protein
MEQLLDFGPCLGVDYSDTLRHVLGLKPQGCALEFGVAAGDSLRMIAKVMPAVGFDVFTGLPEDWRPGYPKGMFASAPPDIPNTRLVAGLFEDTLPRFDFRRLGYIGLVHFDADLYSSTKTALDYVGPYLQPGCYCVFDEFHGWSGWESGGEHQAWQEFVRDNGTRFDVVGYGPEQYAVCIHG